jgi:hypothetical protein
VPAANVTISSIPQIKDLFAHVYYKISHAALH